MSTPTLPRPAADRAPEDAPARDLADPSTDDGLRHLVLVVQRSNSWDHPAGRRLLAEIRRRAVRNAAHVASSTGAAVGRGLVDDVLLAAWMVLRRHGDKVLAVGRPWAYLMSSAQKQVIDEVRAQQLLTNASAIRGRAREVLPSLVRPVGCTATDLATALRHEPSAADASRPAQLIRQIGRHEPPPLVAATAEQDRATPHSKREPWFNAFVDLLVSHGAERSTTVAAVDRLSDLFAATYLGWWEWAARRDPILAQLGLTPNQCGALVALLAGSRRYRHTGKQDSLLAAAVRSVTEQGRAVEMSDAQRRRVAVFVGATEPPQSTPDPTQVALTRV